MTMKIDHTASAARELTIEELLQVSGGHNPPGDILPPPRPKTPGETMNSLAVPPDQY